MSYHRGARSTHAPRAGVRRLAIRGGILPSPESRLVQARLLVFTILAGVLNTLQSGSNATLNKRLEHPLASAAVVYLGGLAVIVLGSLGGLLLGRGGLPAADRAALVPWWGWIGGTLGLVYVFAMFLVAPKLGAAVFTAVSVTAGVLTSLVLDHFGWMGFDPHPAGWGRIVGGLLIVGGLGLIAKF
ncbi:hypothetical protein tb265_47380 [Gemmatimonadetes bacterium T265]|nr:hypothetical protein tb265_47380 [Gemmatimonadetes bacterium T265]